MPRVANGSTLGPYPYRILRFIADGGTSSTYLASVEDDPHRRVVIKLTPSDNSFAEQALMNEMQHLRRLDHPGIVRRHRVSGHTLSASAVVDAARAALPGKPWFSVLEYLEGDSLERLLAQHKPLPTGLALAIGAKVADALAYMHERDVIHLDIKPANILFRGPLTESVDPVLIDFGIARARGQSGLEGGTRAYCAPERLLAELDVSRAAAPDPAMDVYSLGVILFEALVGKRPFAERKERTTNAMMHGQPTMPSLANPDLSRDLDDMLLTALSRDPAERPTAAQLAVRLHVLANSARYRDYEFVAAPPQGRSPRAALPWVGAGVAAALTVGLLVIPRLPGAPAAIPTATAVEQAAPVATATVRAAPTRTSVPPSATVLSPTPRPERTSTPQPTFTPQTERTSTAQPTFTPPPD